MEILRRSLLVGCLLPGLWLLRLTPLEPLVTISPADAMPGLEVHSGSGPGWDALMEELDALSKGKVPPGAADRVTWLAPGPNGSRFTLFMRASDEAIGALRGIGVANRTTYVSASRPGGEARYRMDLHAWTRSDFRPGAGFTGQPEPPSSLLYPLQILGVALVLVGAALFLALPRPTQDEGSMALLDLVLLAGVAVFFAAPLFAVGGSVQALTRGAWLTIPCWILAAGCMHLFAKPTRNVRVHLFAAASEGPDATSSSFRNPAFLRIGSAFLALAVGPVAALVAASVAIWNR